jgi:hypothetical protein
VGSGPIGVVEFAWLGAAFIAIGAVQVSAADALERLQPARLKAVRESVESLRAQWRPVESKSGYGDFRALLHVHSHWSHDSRGTLDEVVAAAKATGTSVIMFTEHPADHYDYFTDGHAGQRDGVLLVPGAETGGLLAFPTRSLKGEQTSGAQALADLVRRDRGLVFLSHLEERMDWEIAGLTGVEIYNTHADVKDEKGFLAALRNPLLAFGILPAMRQYPQESFAALQDYPADYVRRWDELTRKSRLTGVAANDAHQNQAVILRLTEDGKARMENALGKKLIELDPTKIELLKSLVADKKPGDVIFEQYLDRYEHSFRYVSTHLLMKELSRPAVWEALEAGRAYVAFDWMADPSGFVFEGRAAADRIAMGGEVHARPLQLHVEAPLQGKIRLLRDGEVLEETKARTLSVSVDRSGVYRVEVWLTVAGEDRPWILSNPIYLRDIDEPCESHRTVRRRTD